MLPHICREVHCLCQASFRVECLSTAREFVVFLKNQMRMFPCSHRFIPLLTPVNRFVAELNAEKMNDKEITEMCMDASGF